MKKVVSILITLAVVLSCISFSVIPFGASNKITDELQKQIDKIGDNDKLTVQIWVNCVIDKEEIDGEARRQLGYFDIFSDGELTNKYIILYQKLISAKEKEARNAVIEKIGIAQEDIYYSMDVMILANLTKAQVLQAATYSDVEVMYYKPVEEELYPAPTEPQTEAPTKPKDKPVQEQVEPGYYLSSKDTRGIMTPSNKFVRTDDTEHEEYVLRNCKLYASEKLLIKYTADGLKATSFYPKYTPYILYGYIKADGLYDIYFRPNRDGDDYTDNFGWVYKTMRVEYKGSEDVYKHYLYQDRFNAYIRERYVEDGDYEYADYDEIYYHKDESGETDWVLIQAEIPIFEPTIGNWFVSNRVVASFGGYCPFYGMMGIYDVKKDKFFDVIYIDTSQYDDFDEIYDKVGYGQLMGVLDLDDEISVMDVTILQRCHAEIIPFPQSDVINISYGWGPSYIEPYYGKRIRYCSDFDRNGTRDIIDATCIQRYLAGLPYPVEPPID